VVTLAALIGTGYLVVQLIHGESFFDSFIRGCVLSFVLMIVLSLGHSLASGGQIEEAEAGASWRVKLREPLTRTKRALGLLENRVSDQMTTVNQRLYELEKAVFKQDGSGTDGQE
jgi:hypothetical protein